MIGRFWFCVVCEVMLLSDVMKVLDIDRVVLVSMLLEKEMLVILGVKSMLMLSRLSVVLMRVCGLECMLKKSWVLKMFIYRMVEKVIVVRVDVM